MSSSNSPCAACKFLRRKCAQSCVFAPYFPPDQPQKFAHVHRVFGASNVAKLLTDLIPAQREDAVNSLAYEAEARLRDPVYGCVGYISILQHRIKQVQHDLFIAKKELSAYIGPAALGTFLPHPAHALVGPHHPYQTASPVGPIPPFGGVMPGMVMGPQVVSIRDQQQQMAEAQLALALAAREQEMMRSYEQQQQQQQQQQEFLRLNAGLDGHGEPGFNQVGTSVIPPAAVPSSGLALVPAQQHQIFDNQFHIHQPQQLQPKNYSEQHRPHRHTRAGSDEGKSGVGQST